MSRAVVTHFDGDPFTLHAWLTLYENNWRGECDKVYLSMYYNPKVVPQSVIEYQKMMIQAYPEIQATIKPCQLPPEIGNSDTLKTVTEDYIGLIESDGLIYGRGIVDQCFRLLENDKQDVVAPHWYLITEGYFAKQNESAGFMRCFTFVRKSILDKTDLDFMPRTIPKGTKLPEEYTTQKDVALDCFGWMSWQMLLLTDKVTYTPANILKPDNILEPYSNFKWVHVRQMSSSALGMGGGEFAMWTQKDEVPMIQATLRLLNADYHNGSAEFTYIKAVAFKMLFLEAFKKRVYPAKEMLNEFASDYKQMLEAVIDCYNLPRERIYEIKGFYKALFNL